MKLTGAVVRWNSVLQSLTVRQWDGGMMPLLLFSNFPVAFQFCTQFRKLNFKPWQFKKLEILPT